MDALERSVPAFDARTTEQKQRFYQEFVRQLHTRLDVDPQDVMVNFVENQDEDWSFGLGRAQFLTGDL